MIRFLTGIIKVLIFMPVKGHLISIPFFFQVLKYTTGFILLGFGFVTKCLTSMDGMKFAQGQTQHSDSNDPVSNPMFLPKKAMEAVFFIFLRLNYA